MKQLVSQLPKQMIPPPPVDVPSKRASSPAAQQPAATKQVAPAPVPVQSQAEQEAAKAKLLQQLQAEQNAASSAGEASPPQEVSQDLINQITQPSSGGGDQAPAPTDIQIHVVKKGDTLSKIAFSYGVSLRELMSYNQISRPNQIALGQELVIPPKQ